MTERYDEDDLLRPDEIAEEERAEVAFDDVEIVGPFLREELDAELEAQDWTAFATGVLDGIEAEEAAPALGAALREEVAEAVAAREGAWADFHQSVMARVEAEAATETVTVAELLTEETEAELLRRDGEWDAFAARVFEAVDAEERALEQAPLEAQAVALLKDEIEGEVDALDPHFAGPFAAQIEKEIFKSAQVPESAATRLWNWVKQMFAPEQGAYGWVAAAAAVLLVFGVTRLPETGPTPVPGESLAGRVTVEQVSFAGDVTVLPDDGLTVVWLSET